MRTLRLFEDLYEINSYEVFDQDDSRRQKCMERLHEKESAKNLHAACCRQLKKKNNKNYFMIIDRKLNAIHKHNS